MKTRVEHVHHLTDVEKDLFVKHHSCFKCRHFYVRYTWESCSNNWPDSDFFTLTAADADMAKVKYETCDSSKPAHDKCTIAAVMTDTIDNEVAHIAAVRTESLLAVMSDVMSYGLDSLDSEYVAFLFSSTIL